MEERMIIRGKCKKVDMCFDIHICDISALIYNAYIT